MGETFNALGFLCRVHQYLHTKSVHSLSRINTGLRRLSALMQAKTGLHSLSRINTGVNECTPPTLKGVPPECIKGTGGTGTLTFGE